MATPSESGGHMLFHPQGWQVKKLSRLSLSFLFTGERCSECGVAEEGERNGYSLAHQGELGYRAHEAPAWHLFLYRAVFPHHRRNQGGKIFHSPTRRKERNKETQTDKKRRASSARKTHSQSCRATPTVHNAVVNNRDCDSTRQHSI